MPPSGRVLPRISLGRWLLRHRHKLRRQSPVGVQDAAGQRGGQRQHGRAVAVPVGAHAAADRQPIIENRVAGVRESRGAVDVVAEEDVLRRVGARPTGGWRSRLSLLHIGSENNLFWYG